MSNTSEINKKLVNAYKNTQLGNNTVIDVTKKKQLDEFDTETNKIKNNIQNCSNTNELLKILITEIREMHRDILKMNQTIKTVNMRQLNENETILNYLGNIYLTQGNIQSNVSKIQTDVSDINTVGINTYTD